MLFTLLTLLAFFSITSGYLCNDFFVGIGSTFFNFVFSTSTPNYIQVFDLEFFLHQQSIFIFSIKFLPLYCTLLGFSLPLLLSSLPYHVFVSYQTLSYVYYYLIRGFFFNYIYIKNIGYSFFKASFLLFLIDKAFLEIVSTVYLKNNVYVLSNVIQYFHKKRSYFDLLVYIGYIFVIGVSFVVVFLFS